MNGWNKLRWGWCFLFVVLSYIRKVRNLLTLSGLLGEDRTKAKSEKFDKSDDISALTMSRVRSDVPWASCNPSRRRGRSAWGAGPPASAPARWAPGQPREPSGWGRSWPSTWDHSASTLPAAWDTRPGVKTPCRLHKMTCIFFALYSLKPSAGAFVLYRDTAQKQTCFDLF